MIIDGIELRLTPASFEDAIDLQDAVAELIGKEKLSLNGADGDESGKIGEDVLALVVKAAGSKKIRECLFKCAERAIYGQEKIDRAFFEKKENRQLYFPIMTEILKENLGPFMGRLDLVFSAIGNLGGNFPKLG